MSERLAFGYGTSGHSGAPDRLSSRHLDPAFSGSTPPPSIAPPAPGREERADWAFIGLMIFTALLFFRPQDQLPALESLHLAEISALGALLAMVVQRLSRGLPMSRLNPEMGGWWRWAG